MSSNNGNASDKDNSVQGSNQDCNESTSIGHNDIDEKGEANSRIRTLTDGSGTERPKISQLRRGSAPIGKVLYELRSKLSIKRRRGRDSKYKDMTFQPIFRKLDGCHNK